MLSKRVSHILSRRVSVMDLSPPLLVASTEVAQFEPILPNELWLKVFRHATLSPDSSGLYSTEYSPFQIIPYDRGQASLLDSDLKTKASLVLVCRRWRALMSVYLYEDIRIRYNAHVLRDVLAEEDDEDILGRWVRRMALVPHPFSVTTLSQGITSIMELCPRLEVLVVTARMTPIVDLSGFADDRLPYHSLKRLDWWHTTGPDDASKFLFVILQKATNLRYLFVGGVSQWLSNHTSKDVSSLPALRTLRLRSTSENFLSKISQLSIPHLSHLILDLPLYSSPASDHLWYRFGRQLRTLQFGKHLHFPEVDSIGLTLPNCPNLIELNYYIFFMPSFEAAYRAYTQYPCPFQHKPPCRCRYHSHSITSIGLHADQNHTLDEKPAWSILADHFEWFAGEWLPSLKRLNLFGDWKHIIEDARFAQLQKPVRRRNVAIEFSM